MHGTVDIVGPGAVALVVALFATGLAAIAVAADAGRRPDSDYAGVAEGRWLYVVPQALYAIAFVLAQIPFVASAMPLVGWIQVVGAPVSFALTIAYLLRVTFPTHERIALRAAARERALGVAVETPDAAAGADDPEPAARV